LATKIVNHKRKHSKLIDRVPVDNGRFEIGGLGDDLNLPAGLLKDGIYPVYLSADGCKITIDITPFAGGFKPSEYSYTEWKREVAKMRRKAVTR